MLCFTNAQPKGYHSNHLLAVWRWQTYLLSQRNWTTQTSAVLPFLSVCTQTVSILHPAQISGATQHRHGTTSCSEVVVSSTVTQTVPLDYTNGSGPQQLSGESPVFSALPSTELTCGHLKICFRSSFGAGGKKKNNKLTLPDCSSATQQRRKESQLAEWEPSPALYLLNSKYSKTSKVQPALQHNYCFQDTW